MHDRVPHVGCSVPPWCSLPCALGCPGVQMPPPELVPSPVPPLGPVQMDPQDKLIQDLKAEISILRRENAVLRTTNMEAACSSPPGD